MNYEETSYGFIYGGAEISRFFSDEKKGWVVIGLITKKYPEGIQLYITKTGKVRIFGKSCEYKITDVKAPK